MSWLFLIVLLPVFAPVFILAVAFLPFRERLATEAQSLARPVSLFKDGQLGWLGAMLCATAIWEIQSATSRGHGFGEHLDAAGLACFVLLLVFNASILVGGALTPTQLPRPSGMRLREHYRVLCSSIAVFAASGIGAALVHFELSK